LKKYNSFTLLEAILSIVIISILSSLIIPKQQDSKLFLARDQLIEDINIIVFKASMDDIFQNDKDFYPDLWQIKFIKQINNKKVVAYAIYANVGKTKTLNKKDKTIINPLSYKPLASSGYYGGLDTNKSSKEVYLSSRYQIDDLKLSKNCSRYSSRKLLFDSLGRIHINNNGRLAKGICKISLFKKEIEVKICIDSQSSFIYSC
jgi:type II secretory pathway pseudopilin PulG